MDVNFSAHDTVLGTDVYLQHQYKHDQILFGHQFVDQMKLLSDGRRTVDLGLLSRTRPYSDSTNVKFEVAALDSIDIG